MAYEWMTSARVSVTLTPDQWAIVCAHLWIAPTDETEPIERIIREAVRSASVG